MACEDNRGYRVRYIYVFDRYRRTNLAVVLGMLLQYEVVIDYLRAFLRPGAALCIGTIRSATPVRFRNGCASDMDDGEHKVSPLRSGLWYSRIQSAPVTAWLQV